MTALAFLAGVLLGGSGALMLADALDWLRRMGESE